MTRSIEVCGCRKANLATVCPSQADGGMNATWSSSRLADHAMYCSGGQPRLRNSTTGSSDQGGTVERAKSHLCGSTTTGRVAHWPVAHKVLWLRHLDSNQDQRVNSPQFYP